MRIVGLPATVRATILLALVLHRPALGAAVRALTREPRVIETEIDGVPVEVVRPGSRGPWPAWVFVNGSDPLRRVEPVVQRLAHGLARGGFLVVVPDLPGLGEGELTVRTLEATVSVIEATTALPDVRGGRTAVCGASAGASLSILAAAHPRLEGLVSVVAAVTPWARLDKIMGLATTRHYEEGEAFVEYPVTPLLRRVVARSTVAALQASTERDALLGALRQVVTDEVDALDAVRRTGLGAADPAVAAVVAMLVNEDPARVAELSAALPDEVQALIRTLSPVLVAGDVSCHVEIVRPPIDQYFPLDEAVALDEALPDARLTVTRVLDHTRPSFSVGHLSDIADFNGFVLRGLAAAARS
jgi:pimeloyl-ACP methyl ester carboxylesterase